ncbi:hypothetical protein BRC82_06415 [Halobacteriales archaeon QS_1_67_19]|nr:MAG: hypothetical protein BRC82_06415 [Halobacteriales archaeon QS_1_67_19]
MLPAFFGILFLDPHRNTRDFIWQARYRLGLVDDDFDVEPVPAAECLLASHEPRFKNPILPEMSSIQGFDCRFSLVVLCEPRLRDLHRLDYFVATNVLRNSLLSDGCTNHARADNSCRSDSSDCL